MNLEESNLFKEKLEKDSKNKRKIILSIVACSFVLVLLILMIMVLKYQDSITDKLFLDDKQQPLSSDFYKIIKDADQDVIYLNVKQLGEMLSYKYTNGEYNKYSEDEDSCYLQNDFEIVSMSEKSDVFKKYTELSGDKPLISNVEVTSKNENGYNEIFSLKHPIKIEDGKIYASLDDAILMFNISVNWKDYRYKIYSLEYMVEYSRNVVGKLGYTEMSGYYENLKSVVNNFIIIGNGTEGKSEKMYGVIDFTGKEIIGPKYSEIKFVQNAQEFYVTASNGTMGIIASDGKQIIKPSEYQEISLLDDEKQLYLVKKDGEYGVIGRDGEIIIHPENDGIGLDLKDFEEDLENKALLFGKVIPVKKDGKYGMCNLDGSLTLDVLYDLGYISTSKLSTAGNEESVLLIPAEVGIEGIVVCQNNMYGIYDVNRETLIVPCSFNKIYSVRKSGITTYYIDFDEEPIELSSFLKENDLALFDENGEKIEE